MGQRRQDAGPFAYFLLCLLLTAVFNSKALKELDWNMQQISWTNKIDLHEKHTGLSTEVVDKCTAVVGKCSSIAAV